MNNQFKMSDEKFDKLVETICSRLSEGKRVRRNLPGGRIHIDRPLPFLCVYRHPPKRGDEGTERLIKGEAAYLVVTGDSKFQYNLEKLLQGVVNTLSSQFGAFLIFEIWSAPKGKSNPVNSSLKKPTFKILTENSQYSSYASMLSSLYNSLKSIRILKVESKVAISYEAKVTPPGLLPILSEKAINDCRCHVIGLEVQPIYRGKKKNELFPIVLQTLHRGLSRSVKRLCYEFIQTQTTQQPPSYQALGRRAVVKAVWDIDSRLSEVSSAFDFLLLITPVNSESAWNEFKNNKYQKTPEFYYRPLPVDPALLKRALYNIPIERVEDPTLALLFREKQMDVAHRLNMLRERGTRSFLFGSLQLYGDVDSKLVKLAKDLLKKIPTNDKKESYIDAKEFAKRAEAEISSYRKIYPGLKSEVYIREDIPGVLANRGNLLIGSSARVSTARANALIQHEVGTHIITYYNGLTQPLKQLRSGLAGYEELQEGLALLSEYFVGELILSRMRTIASRVIAARSLTDGHSFVETFHELVQKYSFEPQRAFRTTLRIYRGGGFTKDIIYLRGLVKVMDYLKKGGNLDILFVGKFANKHIPIIQELLSRKVLHPSVLRPRYLDDAATLRRIEKIKNGFSVIDLMKGEKE